MATPAQIWSTVTGAGLANGTSLADAYSHANARVAVNALGALSQALLYTPCGGPIQLGNSWEVTKDGTSTYPITMQGRNAGDTADALFEIDANIGVYDAVTLTVSDFWRFKYITAANAGTAKSGWNMTANADACAFYRCQALGNAARGWMTAGSSTKDSTCLECYAGGNGTDGFNGLFQVNRCVAYDNATGFDAILSMVTDCLSHGNSSYGYNANRYLSRCVAYGNTASGFRGHSSGLLWTLCVSESNGTAGFLGLNTGRLTLVDCASYNNTGGRLSLSAYIEDEGAIVLGSSAFVDAAGGDFRLNDRADGGHLVRQLGWTVPGLGQIAYPDGGAIAARATPPAAFVEAWH